MKIIRIFSDFCTSENARDAFSKVYFDGLTENDNFKIVCDDSYTHAILMNTAMPVLKNIPRENVLGLAFEPIEFLRIDDAFITYVTKYCGMYFIGSLTKGSVNLTDPFTNHYSYMWFTQERKNYFNNVQYPKKGNMSIWVSRKTDAPGHKYRHVLVQEILRRNLPIDIWGHGCSFYHPSPRIKGSHENEEPFRDYKFCISIENFLSDDYISEKFTNCIAFGTIPIYMGAKNVEKYFGDNWGYRLTGDVQKDIEIIEGILKSEEGYNVRDVSEVRKELFEGNGSFLKFVQEW